MAIRQNFQIFRFITSPLIYVNEQKTNLIEYIIIILKDTNIEADVSQAIS